jgi:pectinesterase
MTQRLSARLVLTALLFAGSVPVNVRSLTVAADGTGDFATVQAAVDAAPANSPERVVIHIKPGVYKARVHVPKTKARLTFRGEDARTTVLTYDLTAKSVVPPATQPVGTSGSYSVLVEGDEFVAENLTFENAAAYPDGADVGQAVALRTTGKRQVFRNCRMLGWQDTLYVHEGSVYVADCHVEGRVDFIFGRATAVFERCTIHSKNGGYVTAAATAQTDPFGFVFLDCRLTGAGEPQAYLGRPWRDYGAVAFLRCEMGAHVRPAGWDNWRNPAREKTARFAEYKCMGPGAKRAERVPWSRELTDEEAAKHTVENILGAEFAAQVNVARATKSGSRAGDVSDER